MSLSLVRRRKALVALVVRGGEARPRVRVDLAGLTYARAPTGTLGTFPIPSTSYHEMNNNAYERKANVRNRNRPKRLLWARYCDTHSQLLLGALERDS